MPSPRPPVASLPCRSPRLLSTVTDNGAMGREVQQRVQSATDNGAGAKGQGGAATVFKALLKSTPDENHCRMCHQTPEDADEAAVLPKIPWAHYQTKSLGGLLEKVPIGKLCYYCCMTLKTHFKGCKRRRYGGVVAIEG
jgi:hypothetical protein